MTAGESQASEELPGVPDCFQRLWTPHRIAYITGGARDECPFCTNPERSDAEGLIVHRGEHCFVVMNLFPYSPGHVLVCPYRHVGDYTELEVPETEELARLTQASMRVLRATSNPAGFNLGMNQGAVAGAGIPGHLHQHVVPRWPGDTNFLPIVARTRALPILLGDARTMLAEAWEDAC